MQRDHGLGSLFGGLIRSAMPLIKRGALALGKGALKTGLGVAGDVLSGQSIKCRQKDAMISKVLGSSTHGPPGIRLVHRTIKRKPTRRLVSVARKRRRQKTHPDDIFGN